MLFTNRRDCLSPNTPKISKYRPQEERNSNLSKKVVLLSGPQKAIQNSPPPEEPSRVSKLDIARAQEESRKQVEGHTSSLPDKINSSILQFLQPPNQTKLTSWTSDLQGATSRISLPGESKPLLLGIRRPYQPRLFQIWNPKLGQYGKTLLRISSSQGT